VVWLISLSLPIKLIFIIIGILDVRNDKTPTTWILVSYENNDIKKPLTTFAKGSGSVDHELKSHLKSDQILYGLVRVVDQIDNSATVKFAFIFWIGSAVSHMAKAKISVQKGRSWKATTTVRIADFLLGGVAKLFSPFHVDFNVSEARELSDDILLAKGFYIHIDSCVRWRLKAYSFSSASSQRVEKLRPMNVFNDSPRAMTHPHSNLRKRHWSYELGLFGSPGF
jgi:hypothetical protein